MSFEPEPLYIEDSYKGTLSVVFVLIGVFFFVMYIGFQYPSFELADIHLAVTMGCFLFAVILKMWHVLDGRINAMNGAYYALRHMITPEIARASLGRLSRDARDAFDKQDAYIQLSNPNAELEGEVKEIKNKFWMLQNFIVRTQIGKEAGSFLLLPKNIQDYYDW